MKRNSFSSMFGLVAGLDVVFSLVAVFFFKQKTAYEIDMLVALGLVDASKAAAVKASLGLTSSSSTTSGHTFSVDLTVGSKGADVTALQTMLGISPATGYFGSLTKAAVIKYQLANGITPAAGYVGPKTRSMLSSGSMSSGTGSTVVPSGTDLKVSLAATSPVSGAVVAGQSIADLAEYTFTNTSAAPAVVTNVTLQRGGVSNDAALSNVYLYSGVTRLTDSASVSTGKITFNAPSGLFTIPAGSSMTIAVRADITSGTTYNGQIFVVSLTGVTSNVPVTAVYPISAASQTVSSATLASVIISSSSVSTTSVDPQTDYTMWYGTASVSTNDVWMKAIALRQVGSVATGDLGNFRLFIDGNQVGSALSAYDVNNYLTFDLSGNPLKLTTGSHTIKLVGDIIGGSTKNFSFQLRQASDLNLVDSQLNVNVLATTNSGYTFPFTTGVQSVNSGTLTITKTTDSPSGNVTLSASGVALARFQIKAAGEPIKIENLKVSYAGSNVGPLRNGALFVNGSQVGSTADIGSTTATQYNSLNFTVVPGSPVTLEVRSDIYTSSGAQLVNGNTVTVSLVAGSANADLTKSGGNISTGAVTANQLTVSQGSLSLSKYTAYANQSMIAPQTAVKLGDYTLTAGTTENLNLNTITVNFLGSGASTTATSSITDVYVVYGNKTSSNKSTIVSGDNSYAVNYTLPAGQTIDVSVYGTLGSGLGGADVIVTKLQIAGQTSQSNQTVTVPSGSTYTTGQTFSITVGSLNLAAYNLAASTTVVANNTVKAGSFKFVATGDTYTVDQLMGFIPFASAGNVASVVYKIGSTVLNGSGTPIDTSDGTNAMATTTGLNIVVPANNTSGVIVDAYLNLASIGTPGGATSSSNVLYTLTGYRKQSSTGVQTLVGNVGSTGNVQYVFKSVPTITNVALTDTLLQAGTKTLDKIQVAADAAGAVQWSKVAFTITKASANTLATASTLQTGWTLTDVNDVAIPGSFASSTGDLSQSGVTSGVITFTPTNPEEIAAGTSKTYKLKAVVGGTIATNDAVTTKIAAGTAGHIQSTTSSGAGTNASFVWSDESFSPHSTTSPDWNNDVLIKNIPTDSQNLTN